MPEDLLFEVGAEELPASFVTPALQDLKTLFAKGAQEARLAHGAIHVYGTPRRLAILAEQVADVQKDLSTDVLGPPVRVAFDSAGKPTAVAEKWALAQGSDVSKLLRKETPKGEYVYLERHMVGRPAREVLPGILLAAMRGIAFRKSMRWGWEEETFARPVQWMVALHGTQVVDFAFADVRSGDLTRGHRFLAKEPIRLRSPRDYVGALEAAHVLVDPEQRRALVKSEVEQAASQAGGRVLDDPGLLETVTFLVELPSAVQGSFDAEFLDLPPEVLVSEAKGHQKYFSVVDEGGRVMPHFVAVSNTPVRDTAVSRAGYERVLRARLSDARFFFNEDRKHPLSSRVESLKRIVFQEKLGTSHEKMERFRALSLFLSHQVGLGTISEGGEASFASEGAGASGRFRAAVHRAATLCKADLVTGMVGEFPELQGVMGREYARPDEPPEVAQAIFEHYLPRNAGDVLPERDEGAIVGLADRLDTITGIIGIGKGPTGATDPYGLRRACIAILRIVLARGYTLSLCAAVDKSVALLGERLAQPAKARADVLRFFRDRLESTFKEQGHRADVVEAVLSAGFDDVLAAQRRLEALSAIVSEPDFGPLATTFKRVANIVEKQGKGLLGGDVAEALLSEEEERLLLAEYLSTKGRVEAAMRDHRFGEALRTIAGLKRSVDRFFDKVLVMTEEPAVRRNRVTLLFSIAQLFGGLADFAKIHTGEPGRS